MKISKLVYELCKAQGVLGDIDVKFLQNSYMPETIISVDVRRDKKDKDYIVVC